MRLTADPFEGSASATAGAVFADLSTTDVSALAARDIMAENISPDQLVGYELCIAGTSSIYLWHKYEPCERPYIVPDESPANVANLVALVRIHVRKHH